MFTSGATGPAKGVVYRHRPGSRPSSTALRDGVRADRPDDRLVAAFAPFALYGPALGIASAVPAAAQPGPRSPPPLWPTPSAAVDATVVFASPAALRNVVATADDARRRRTAPRWRGSGSSSPPGAPVPAALLHALRAVLPARRRRTPRTG